MPRLAMTVNGVEVALDLADGDEPLLSVLRNRLGLDAARFGCGQGLCGACSILVDGRLTRSCDVPAWWAEGRVIVTAEADAALSPTLERVRQSLADHCAGQCGYCLSGIAIALTALFEAEPNPDRAAIDAALERNLCRCGAHHRILAAAQSLAHAPEVAA